MVAPPYLVPYAITRKCNLKCKHCYSDATDTPAQDELSTIEAKRLYQFQSLQRLQGL